MDPFFKHPLAVVETHQVGNRTRVWAFAHVLAGAVIGEDCNICDHTFIENDVKVGNRVTVKCGVQLWDGVRLEDDVFVGPNVTFTNDRLPRSGQHLAKYPETVVREGASIGANATVLPGITIGKGAMVGAGSVVTRDVPDRALVVGNPARHVRYLDEAPRLVAPKQEEYRSLAMRPTLVSLPVFDGVLNLQMLREALPFSPEYLELTANLSSSDSRAWRAYRETSRFVLCVKGSVTVRCRSDDGTEEDFILSSSLGLCLHPMTWHMLAVCTSDAQLFAFSSPGADRASPMRDHEEAMRRLRRPADAD